MIRYSDMDENMKKEVMEVCTTACERHTANNELVSRVQEVLARPPLGAMHMVSTQLLMRPRF